MGWRLNKARAAARATELAPTIKAIQAGGVATLRGIAAALNERGIPTARGRGLRQPVQVARVLARLGLPALPRRGPSPEAGEAGREVGTARADARAIALAPIIADIRADGVTAPYAIAAVLTKRGVPTARGHRFWTSKQGLDVLDRLARLTGRRV